MIFKRGEGYVNSSGEPVTEDGKPLGESPDAEAQLSAVTDQRDSLQAQLDAGYQELQGKLDAVTAERDSLKSTLADTVSRDDHDRLVQSNQEQALQYAEVTTERNEALGREQGALERNAQLTDENTALKQQVADLEAKLAAQGDGENAAPGDTDQRTKAELKAALDGKGVTYDANLKRDGLLALAAEHGV